MGKSAANGGFTYLTKAHVYTLLSVWGFFNLIFIIQLNSQYLQTTDQSLSTHKYFIPVRNGLVLLEAEYFFFLGAIC